jgi:hypothetical protein
LTRNPGGKGSLSQTDEVEENELFKINRMVSMKENSSPSLLVGNNGVVYDISNTNKINGFQSTYGVHVPKEVIRRRLDMLLYSTSQNIKNIIFRQTQETQTHAQPTGECWWWINSAFAMNLSR